MYKRGDLITIDTTRSLEEIMALSFFSASKPCLKKKQQVTFGFVFFTRLLFEKEPKSTYVLNKLVVFSWHSCIYNFRCLQSLNYSASWRGCCDMTKFVVCSLLRKKCRKHHGQFVYVPKVTDMFRKQQQQQSKVCRVTEKIQIPRILSSKSQSTTKMQPSVVCPK